VRRRYPPVPPSYHVWMLTSSGRRQFSARARGGAARLGGMVKIALVGSALILIAGAAGCGSPDHPSAAASSPAPDQVPVSPSPSPSPSPLPLGVHRLGETVIEARGRANATVYAYKQPVAEDAPKPDQAGYEWGAADVKTCALASPGISVTTDPWTLAYADSTAAQASSVTYQQFPLPEYKGKDIYAGKCQRGWIVFPVPSGQRPQLVEYQPEGSPPIDWDI
jgi:hypothetical protein